MYSSNNINDLIDSLSIENVYDLNELEMDFLDFDNFNSALYYYEVLKVYHEIDRENKKLGLKIHPDYLSLLYEEVKESFRKEFYIEDFFNKNKTGAVKRYSYA